MGPLNEYFLNKSKNRVRYTWIGEILQKYIEDRGIEFDERRVVKDIQKTTVLLLIAPYELSEYFGDLIVWEIREIVMILEEFDNFVQAASFKTQRLQQHFVNCSTPDRRKMTEIIIVCFK